jgi:hypothetical protein
MTAMRSRSPAAATAFRASNIGAVVDRVIVIRRASSQSDDDYRARIRCRALYAGDAGSLNRSTKN